MDKAQSAVLRDWERNVKFLTPAGKMTLSFIIDETRPNNNPCDMCLPEYMTRVHPLLYYFFVIDWSKLDAKHTPTNYADDPKKLGAYIVQEWIKKCSKHKNYLTYGMLSNYDKVQQLTDVIASIVPDGITVTDEQGNRSFDFDAFEERLYSIRQEALDKQKQEQIEAARRIDEERKKLQAKSEQKPANTPSCDIDKMLREIQLSISEAGIDADVYIKYCIAESNFTVTIDHCKYGHHFTANSIDKALTACRSYITNLIDDILIEKQRMMRKAELQKQIDEQTAEFSKAMQQSQFAIQQMQEQMNKQQAEFQKQMDQLKRQMSKI